MIKLILGLGFILLGIVLGLYLGFWLFFIGGIVQSIEGIKANPIDSLKIAMGIAKFLLSGVVGWLSFGILCGIGGAIMEDN